MVDMGMGEDDKDRVIPFSMAFGNELSQHLCLIRKAARVNQEDGVRCPDQKRVRRDDIDFPDIGKNLCPGSTR
jgi:hypothetical protein